MKNIKNLKNQSQCAFSFGGGALSLASRVLRAYDVVKLFSQEAGSENHPLYLWEREEFVNERSEFTNLGEGNTLSRIAKIRLRSLSNSALSQGERTRTVPSLGGGCHEVTGEGFITFAEQTETGLPSYRPNVLTTSEKLDCFARPADGGNGARNDETTLVSQYLSALVPSKCIAFTLAEVLITLGIIGVVAAITMPVLIQNHKKIEIATSVKKFYSTMSQAILMSEIDNGPSEDWTKEDMVRGEDGETDNAEQVSRALTYFNNYIANYIKYIKIDENPQDISTINADGQADRVKVYLADGTFFFVNNGSCAHFQYDANGSKNPNVAGRDRFDFLICPSKEKLFSIGGLVPYDFISNNSREKAKQECIDAPTRCSHLLMIDGWEFKDDYPYKI